MEAEQLEALKKCLTETIRVVVNGKIDDVKKENLKQTNLVNEMRKDLNEHNAKHEANMIRILPVVEAFESAQTDLSAAKKGGKLVLWLAATITAIGGAVLVLRAIFFNN